MDNLNDSNSKLIASRFPNAGKVKINTNGSSINETGYGSYGGLARNDQGRWIEGFYGFNGESIVLGAELWGIKQGLKLAKERGWEEMELDSDSKTAVDLINNNNEVENHQEMMLIKTCRKLKIDTKAEVGHILRGNKCADGLAKLGAPQSELHVRILVPPDYVVENLMEDMIQVTYPRGS